MCEIVQLYEVVDEPRTLKAPREIVARVLECPLSSGCRLHLRANPEQRYEAMRLVG
jgi:hypothetical protein